MTTTISIFDYGAGNLHSLAKGVEAAGADVRIVADPIEALETDALVLPGVGAFAPAAEKLAVGRDEVAEALREGLPCLGVCLGMQLLFDGSDEGNGEGLGLIPGRVTALRARRIPQIGWNTVEEIHEDLLTRAGLSVAYYANGFVGRPVDERAVTAWSTHDGDRFPAAVRVGKTVGVQFHPEKSSVPGVRFLREFVASVTARARAGAGRR